MAEEKQGRLPIDDRPLSDDEKAYFDSRGEKDIPAAAQDEPAEPTPQAEAPQAQGASVTSPADTGAQTSVPQAALHEERKRRQEAEEKARQMELLNARMEERFRAFRDAVTPRQQQPQGPPAVDQDIFGAVKHLQQENARTRGEIDNYKRQIQQEDQMKALKQWGADNEAAFVRANVDYYEALKYLRNARAKDLQVWGMSPSAIGTQLAHEESQLLARAAAERRNPAEMAYALATQRGYSAPAPAANSGDQRQQVDLNRIEAGQRQSSSLSNVGGGAGRDVGDIEIEDLLKMNDKEFGDFIEKYPGRFRRLKGAAH